MHTTQALIIAGTRSGCGKTCTCLALAAALVRRGLTVQCCKIGPDFIDPAHHQVVSGRPSYNLDTWMHNPRGIYANLARALRRPPKPDILLIEGVMGLFDGGSSVLCRAEGDDVRHPLPSVQTYSASTAESALLLNLPVLLLLDAQGMGQSVAASARGFFRHMPELHILGLACTGVGGPGHQQILRESLREFPLLGLLPKNDAPHLPSRHLGLVTAQEAPLSESEQARSAKWLEKHLDVDALLALLPPLRAFPAEEFSLRPQGAAKTVTIAVARDQAFCFLYPELPEMLEEAGAQLVFFSPLEDAGLPSADIVYLPGGYPELFAERLARNTSMRGALRAFSAAGGIVYGECGGYIYLMEELRLGGQMQPMSGCLPLACELGTARAALGYRLVRDAAGPFARAGEYAEGRGHEYHYARITRSADLPALWRLYDRAERDLGPEGTIAGATAGSWVHLAPCASVALWRNLLRLGATS